MNRNVGLVGALCGLAVVLVLAACERRETVEIDPTQVAERAGRLQVGSGDQAGGRRVYRFGFDLRASPQEDARQYLPLLAHLEQATGQVFELDFTPAGEELEDRLGRGSVDFAAMGAVSYIEANDHYGAVILARGLNAEGAAVYRSKIVVAPESPIRSVEALRGKRFAFGAISSTQGHLAPREYLLEQGLELKDLGSHVFTGSHRNCADAVITRAADACGMQDTLADALVKAGKVRVLWESAPIPSSGIAARRQVPPEVIEAVRKALLAFDPVGKHRAGLYHWERTEMPRGFQAAAPGDYAQLRDWMRRIDISAAMHAHPSDEAHK